MAARLTPATRALLSLPTYLLVGVGLLSLGAKLQQRSDGSSVHVDVPPSSMDPRLYTVPEGAYTAADVRANGPATPAERFRGVAVRHDLHPASGDVICPITHTKANPRLTWTIGGKRYLFCCPPCMDEFVQRAKVDPASIQPPEAYVQR